MEKYVRLKRCKFLLDDQTKIVEEYKTGLSIEDLSRQHDCNNKTISRILHINNVVIRPYRPIHGQGGYIGSRRGTCKKCGKKTLFYKVKTCLELCKKCKYDRAIELQKARSKTLYLQHATYCKTCNVRLKAHQSVKKGYCPEHYQPKKRECPHCHIVKLRAKFVNKNQVKLHSWCYECRMKSSSKTQYEAYLKHATYCKCSNRLVNQWSIKLGQCKECYADMKKAAGLVRGTMRHLGITKDMVPRSLEYNEIVKLKCAQLKLNDKLKQKEEQHA